MSPTRPGTECRATGCHTRLIFAKHASTNRPVPLEERDRPPFSDEAAGCLVVVTGQAWRPADLIEHFRTRFEITESAARELVEGYPFHRPHTHDPADLPGKPKEDA